MDLKPRKTNPCPWDEANFISRLFFWWIIPLFVKGSKRGLQLSDIYDCPDPYTSNKNGTCLEKEWRRELQKLKSGHQPSLVKALCRVFGLRYCLNSLLIIFLGCFIQIMQPLILGCIMEHFERVGVYNQHKVYLYASELCLFSLLHVLVRHVYFFNVGVIMMDARVACCALVYKKALKLSTAALKISTMGQMVNLLSNDAQKFNQFDSLDYLVIAPLQTVIIVCILWTYIGYASLAGMCILLLYIPFQGLMFHLLSIIRMKTAILTDERIRLINDIISGMRVIKMYGWEIPFSKLVDLSRRKEMMKIRQMSLARAVTYAVSQISPRLTLLTSFAVFLFCVQGDLTPQTAFVCMALIKTMQSSVTDNMNYSIITSSEAITSIRRIEKFLLLEEQPESPIASIPFCTLKSHKCCVKMTNVNASWNKSCELHLKNITLTVDPGELLVVIGPVGCGKTSLLMSILGELPVTSGDLKVQGKVSYVPQESWVFGGSIRQNILFGKDFEELKYQKLLNVCALESDMDILPFGDSTTVGERGFCLSGGQKARVNLARALYLDGDILLLDDPLSAVDSSVSRHIFEKCIKEYLKHKVRILVTHQVQYLKEATKILVMKKGGCDFFHSYKQLTESGLDLGFLLDDQEDNKRMQSSILRTNGKVAHEISNEISFKTDSFESTNNVKIQAKTDNQNIDNVPVIPEESKSVGVVDINVYKKYISSGAGPLMMFFTLIFFIGSEALSILSDFWLTKWTTLEQFNYNMKNCWNEMNKTIFNNTDLNNSTYGTFNKSFIGVYADSVRNECLNFIQNYGEEEIHSNQDADRNFHLIIYSTIILSVLLFVFMKPTLFYTICLKASINIHHKMFKNVMRVPITFFDTNPVGRILNRFSKDIGIVDDTISFIALDVCTVFVTVIGSVCLICVVEPWLLLPSGILAILFFSFRSFYLTTARDINRYEAITKSHTFSHLSNSIIGLTSIRAFRAEKYFEQTFDDYQDKHTATWFLFLSGSRWFGAMLDMICVVYTTCAVFGMIMISTDDSYGSKMGLVILYAMNLVGLFQDAVKDSASIENYMVSTERILEYCKLEQEAALESDQDKKPPENWPFNAHIIYKNVYLKYAQNQLVLKNLNFEIYPHEKIGIVGRTGAGKSSLIATLFRMVEPEGVIKIDGVDIKTIGLNDLRKRISIIPQDPVLFTGPLRRNLDPFNEHSDSEEWKALEEACLKKVIEDMPGGLDSEVSEGGNNFSVGQRQLICLSRAILKRSKILVLDEATANIDTNTDSLIQRTIKECFKHCTVLTIAHRLHTIIDFDRVIVLDAGEVKEFERPYILLQNSDSLFFRMVQMTGPSMAKQLHEAAQASYLKKSSSANRTEKNGADGVTDSSESITMSKGDANFFINSAFESSETTHL